MGRSLKSRSENQVPNAGGMDEILAALMQGGSPPGNTDSRIVMLAGDVSEYSIAQVIGQMLELANADRSKPINLILSTYGGSVDEMFGLYDTINFLPCPVHTIALGKVMSAGILMLAAGAKGERSIGRTSRLMIHGASGGTSGNVFAMENDVKEHKRLNDLMADCLVSETKMSKKKVNEILSLGHDYYLTADEAIKLGIADRVIGK